MHVLRGLHAFLIYTSNIQSQLHTSSEYHDEKAVVGVP